MNKKLIGPGYLVAGIALAALLLTGSMDFEDQMAEQANYCQQVKDGVWPNFKPEVKCNSVAAR